jgi:hypothetical protein
MSTVALSTASLSTSTTKSDARHERAVVIPQRFGLALAFGIGWHIKKKVGAALSCHGDIHPLIAIQVTCRDLKSNTDVALFDDRLFEFAVDQFVEIDFWHILPAWIATIVSEVTFPADQFVDTITIQIGKR